VHTSSQSLKQMAYEQLKEYLVSTVYLWVVFSLFVMYKAVILAEHQIAFVYHGLAIINALALAKVMLVVKDLHLGEQFDEAPLIYPTLLKSALYAVVLACFKILEETAIGLYHGKSFHQSIAELGGGSLTAILTLTLLMFVVLIPFVGFGELQRVFGAEKLARVFFHQRALESQVT